MGNFLNKILLYKESTVDTIPSNPKCFSIKTESIGLTGQESSEVNNELGNGRGASAKAFGASDISGDMGMIWNTDNAPILLTHAIGDATSTANATSDSWAGTTVYAKGDLVNHTDGLHTLVCYTAGTSGATEPDLSSHTTANAGRNTRTPSDGSVVWLIMPKLYEQSGERGECLTSFGVEVKDDITCGSSDPEYCRYGGLRISSLPFNITGDTNAVKSSASLIGLSEEDSLIVTDEGGTYQAMSAKSGFTEVEVISDYYLLGDCTFNLDGVEAPMKTTSFDATINNNASADKALNKKKIDNIGLVNIDGSFAIVMDTTTYVEAARHVDKAAKFVFAKANGCLMELEFPQLKLEKTYKEFSTDKTTMLTIPFSAFDTSDSKSVKWRTISPISY